MLEEEARGRVLKITRASHRIVSPLARYRKIGILVEILASLYCTASIKKYLILQSGTPYDEPGADVAGPPNRLPLVPSRKSFLLLVIPRDPKLTVPTR